MFVRCKGSDILFIFFKYLCSCYHSTWKEPHKLKSCSMASIRCDVLPQDLVKVVSFLFDDYRFVFRFLELSRHTTLYYKWNIWAKKFLKKQKRSRAPNRIVCQGIIAKKLVNTPFVPRCATIIQRRGTPIIR